VIDPTEEDIGRSVMYRADHPEAQYQYGKLTSFNDRLVFVLFNPEGSTSQGCRREDLCWCFDEDDEYIPNGESRPFL